MLGMSTHGVAAAGVLGLTQPTAALGERIIGRSSEVNPDHFVRFSYNENYKCRNAGNLGLPVSVILSENWEYLFNNGESTGEFDKFAHGGDVLGNVNAQQQSLFSSLKGSLNKSAWDKDLFDHEQICCHIESAPGVTNGVIRPDGKLNPGFATHPGQVNVKSEIFTLLITGCNEFSKCVDHSSEIPTLKEELVDDAVKSFLAAVIRLRDIVRRIFVFTPAH